MALKKILIFVYGTLKRDQPNHFWLTDLENGFSQFLSIGETLKKYPLVIATKYNIPFLLPEPDTGHIVTGEVFEVDDKMLSRLDILEEHPIYYERRLETIRMKDSDQHVECWTYFLKDYKKELLQLPMHDCYDSKGKHGMPYWERWQRESKYDYKSPVKTTVK